MFFPSGEIQLEAVLHNSSADKAAVVTHPHPLYGGNMDNSVVTAVAGSFAEKGWSTLRFNFRGSGRSGGRHDNGIGEVEDVKAAVSFMREKGFSTLALAGYSFGSRINAEAVSKGLAVDTHVMISPPVNFMSFDDIKTLPDTRLVIVGDQDEFADVSQVRNLLRTCESDARLEVIENADHFYSGKMAALQEILSAFLDK